LGGAARLWSGVVEVRGEGMEQNHRNNPKRSKLRMHHSPPMRSPDKVSLSKPLAVSRRWVPKRDAFNPFERKHVACAS
jgi:hypothetical protein